MEHFRHYARFEISPGRNLYDLRSAGEGWFLYGDVVDLVNQKRLYLSKTFAAHETSLSYQVHPEDSPITVRKFSRWWPGWADFLVIDRKEVRGIILRPYVVYLDADTIRGDEETFAGAEYDFSVPTTDLDFVQSKDGLFTEIVYGKGPSVSEATDYDDLKPFSVTWAPDDHLCPNLFFTAGFRRQALDGAIIERIDALALIADEEPDRYFGTVIYFGGTPRIGTVDAYTGGFRWRLVIPVNNPPFLQESFYISDSDHAGTWVMRPWTSGELSQVEAKSAATDGKTYSIGVINDCICVSEDRFEGNFALYQASDVGQPIVASGDVRVYNWPGQCALWLAPLGFAETVEGRGNPYILRGSAAVANFNSDLIGPGRAYTYGWSAVGLRLEVGVEVWPDTPPAGWPEFGDWLWPDDPGVSPEGSVLEPPAWPPHGDPHYWPSYPPNGWPLDEVWPPTYPPDTPVVATDYAFLEGGACELWYWSPDAKAATTIDTWGTEPDDWPPGTPWPPSGDPNQWGELPPEGWPPELPWPPDYPVPDPIVVVTSPAVPGNWMQWRVEFERAIWAPSGQVPSFTTPFLSGVTVWQAPLITGPNALAYTEPAAVKSATIAEAELGNDTSGNVDVEIENSIGTYGNYPSLQLREGAPCRVTVGTILSDETDQYAAHASLVLTEIDPDAQSCRLRFTDPLGALEFATWDRGDLNFKYWTPSQAIMCVGGLYGIPEEMFDLEDLGEYLLGDWTWEGVSIRSIMSDLSKRGGRGASLWFDPIAGQIKSGCRYCRTKRVAADFESHQDGGWNSTGCVLADVARTEDLYESSTGIDFILTVDTRDLSGGGPASLLFTENFGGRGTRMTGEFLNRLQIQGKGFDGQPLRLYTQDSASISGDPDYEFASYIGWRKSAVIDAVDDLQKRYRGTAKLGETTWDLLGQQMIEKMDCFGQRGVEIPGVTIPQNTDVRPGLVCQVVGGQWSKANGIKFRVRGAQHSTNGRSTLHLQQMIGRLD